MSIARSHAGSTGELRASRRARARCGYTLVELLVSVLVLTVGLLALTGATAVVARQVNGGAQMSLAASVAQSRFERLRATDCTTIVDGTSEQRGVVERWTVARSKGAVTVTDTVVFETPGARRVYAFESLLPCPAASP